MQPRTLVSCIAASIVLGGTLAAQTTTSKLGFYTDRPTYEPCDTIDIHANFQGGLSKDFLLWRVTENGWQQVASLDGVDFPAGSYPIEPAYGSFVRFDAPNQGGPNLGGRAKFTLMGWVKPTFVPGNDTSACGAATVNAQKHIIFAGQIEEDAGGNLTGIAGIGMKPTGELFGYVRAADGTSLEVTYDWVANLPGFSGSVGNELCQIDADDWHHVAIKFNGKKLRLFVDGEDPVVSAELSVEQRTKSAAGMEFRFGASSAALTSPVHGTNGDHLGQMSGVLDDWGLYESLLSKAQIQGVFDGGGPLLPFPELLVRFEDDYGTGVTATSSIRSHVGEIVNHGASVAGKVLPYNQAAGGQQRGLRLNHDQLVDAGWPAVSADGGAKLTIPRNAESGLYVLQVVPEGTAGGTVDLCDGTIPDPRTARCLVVRPSSGSGVDVPVGDVAVLYPVLTWQAYNGWPSDPFATNASAEGWDQRCVSKPNSGACSYSLTKQGNNSAYARMGDFHSRAIYQGWARPSLPASPFSSTAASDDCNYSVLAPASVEMATWIDGYANREGAVRSVHAYSDWDLDDGTLDLDPSKYAAIVLVGHHEYWTEPMLDALNTYVEDGGSVVSVAGNLFAYRMDLQDGVSEVRKWPMYKLDGDADKFSHIASSASGSNVRTGLWRLLEQNAATDRDHLLGTRISIVSFGGNPPQGFGKWAGLSSATWMSEFFITMPLGPIGNILLQGAMTAGSVGHEADELLPVPLPSYALGLEAPVALAQGCGFASGAPKKIDWSGTLPASGSTLESAPLGDLDDEAGSSYWSSSFAPALTGSVCSPSVVNPAGNIVYRAPLSVANGGDEETQRTLAVASTAAPWALRTNDELAELIETVLDQAVAAIGLVPNEPSCSGSN